MTLAAGELVNKALAFFIAIYLARTLGVEGFGLVAFATTLAGYFMLGSDLSLDAAMMRDVARRPADAGALARRVIAIRMVSSLIVTVAYLAVVAVVDRPAETKLTIALYGLLFLPYALTPKGALLGLERRRPWAIAVIAAQLVFVGASLLFIRGPETIFFVPIAQALADVTQAAVVLWALWPVFRQGSILAERWTVTLRRSLPTAWAQGMRILSLNFDSLLIGLVYGDLQLGFYSAAYKLVLFVLGFGGLYGVNLIPAIARYHPGEPEALRRLFGQSIALTGGVALPAAVGGSLLAGPAIALVYGAQYEPGVLPLRILLLSSAATILATGFRNLIFGTNHPKADMVLVSASAMLNVGFNLLLTPRFGLVAAACVTLGSEIFTFLAGWYLARRLLGPMPVARSLLPALASCLVLAALLGGGLQLAPDLWLASALLSGLAYLGCLWLFGGVRLALGRN